MTYNQSDITKCPEDEKWKQLEVSFNIMSDTVEEQNIEVYSKEVAPMIATMMVEINGNISQKGVRFARQFGENYVRQFSQQYILEKGLKNLVKEES